MQKNKETPRNNLRYIYISLTGAAFFLFLFLAILNIIVKREISNLVFTLNPVNFEAQNYPQINNNLAPQISAKGAIVLDKNSQVVLYQKNANLRFPPASTTKIMSALVALDYFKPDEILTIKTATVEGSVLGVLPDDRFKFEDLLYAMLLPSANDAALAIAQNYPGGEKEFIKKMNEKAKDLHLINSSYADPIGLEDNKDYTTSLDLARLASYALNNLEFAKVVATKEKRIESKDGTQYELDNLNKLLEVPGVSGIKTGFTEGAGQVLVTSKKIENTNEEIIIVVMQSEDRFADTQALLNYLEGISYLPIHP